MLVLKINASGESECGSHEDVGFAFSTEAFNMFRFDILAIPRKLSSNSLAAEHGSNLGYRFTEDIQHKRRQTSVIMKMHHSYYASIVV